MENNKSPLDGKPWFGEDVTPMWMAVIFAVFSIVFPIVLISLI